MTRRERVHQALMFRDTDIVPYQVEFTHEAHRKMAEHYGDPQFHARIGNHLALLSTRQLGKWEEVKPGYWRDEWGVVWNRTVDRDIGVVDKYLLEDGSLKGWEPPAINLPGMAKVYSSFAEDHPDEFRIVTIGFSLFERAWSLRGMAALLEDMLESPDFAHELLERIMEWNLAQVDLAVKYDIDAIYFGDDWGSQRGIMPALTRFPGCDCSFPFDVRTKVVNGKRCSPPIRRWRMSFNSDLAVTVPL